MHRRQKLGSFAEKLAIDFLKEKGYKIIEKNYSMPWGEIDIIVKKGDVFVFVEVKANSQEFKHKDFSPESRVDKRKIGKILKTAQLYLESRNNEWRVDIIAVTFYRQEKRAKIVHFKNIIDSLH